MNPVDILRAAIKAVPAVKYALGVVGIIAAISLAGTLLTKTTVANFRLVVLGTVIMLGLMTALVIFAASTRLLPKFLVPAAVVFVYTFLILTLATAGLLFTSVFFRWPINLQYWITGQDPTKVSQGAITPDQTRDVKQHIKELTSKIDYDSPTRARAQIAEIEDYVSKLDSLEARNTAAQELARIVFNNPQFEDIPSRVREIRADVLKAIIKLKVTDLSSLFQNRQLESLDLARMDFSNQNLRGVSFRQAFLINANFAGATLDGATFDDSYIRNARFDNASLRNTDFTDTDWFDSLSLTISQLETVKKGTLKPCPHNETEHRALLSDWYAYPIEGWPLQEQQELISAWREYHRPGSLCSVVSSWNR